MMESTIKTIGINSEALSAMTSDEFKEYWQALCENASDAYSLASNATKEQIIESLNQEIETVLSTEQSELNAFYNVYYQRVAELMDIEISPEIRNAIAQGFRNVNINLVNATYGTDIVEDEVPGLKEMYEKLAVAIEVAAA